MTQLDINTTCNWQSPLPPQSWDCCSVLPSVSFLLSATHTMGYCSKILLQTVELPLLIKAATSPSGFFLQSWSWLSTGLAVLQLKSYSWWTSQETEETPVSAKRLRSKDGNEKLQGSPLTFGAWKFAGISPEWLSTNMWDPQSYRNNCSVAIH